jgi:hypothetical protein
MNQGLGLPCFPLVILAKKISFPEENWSSSGIAQSDALSLAYDDFFNLGWVILKPLQLGLHQLRTACHAGNLVFQPVAAVSYLNGDR